MSLHDSGDHTADVTPSQTTPRRALVVIMAALLGLLGVSGGAAADPKPSISTVKRQVDQLSHEAEVASEQYNATREKLKSVKVMAQAAGTRLAQQKTNVQTARTALGKLAVETYKAGDLQALAVFLDDDPDAMLAAVGLMTSLTDRQAQGVAHLVAEQKRLVEDVSQVTARQKELTAAASQLERLKGAVDDKLAAAKALLARLSGTERAALLRVSQTLDREALAQLGVQVPDNGVLGCDDVGISYPDARAQKVLAYACAQLGKPYSWGADGPGSFDCSGLTMEAWSHAGVSLPHNAAMQAQEGKRVSAGSLLPGDLLYFHMPITHMGLYIGKGLMIHAPHSGDVVRIAPARLTTLVAASRP